MLPILGCLVRAEEIVGENAAWQPVNEQQRRFLEMVFSSGRDDVEQIPEQELRSIASTSADAINAFLREQGFDVRVGPFGEQSFGLASVLRVAVEWNLPGTPFELHTDRGDFRGVRMKPYVEHFTAASHPNPIARIETRSGEYVYMTVADEPLAGLDLVERIRGFEDMTELVFPDVSLEKDIELLRNRVDVPGFMGVVFPRIRFNEHASVDWLAGLHTPDPWAIGQAVQQTRFELDEWGARTESAAAVRMLGSGFIRRPPLVIDQPFYLWKVRPGLTLPILVAYFEEDCWETVAPRPS